MQWATTSWTQVLAARDAPSSEARQALEGLCQAYWYPLYVFVRHQGLDAEEAQDVTQAYFAALVEKDYRARPVPGLENGADLVSAGRRYSSNRSATAASKPGSSSPPGSRSTIFGWP